MDLRELNAVFQNQFSSLVKAGANNNQLNSEVGGFDDVLKSKQNFDKKDYYQEKPKADNTDFNKRKLNDDDVRTDYAVSEKKEYTKPVESNKAKDDNGSRTEKTNENADTKINKGSKKDKLDETESTDESRRYETIEEVLQAVIGLLEETAENEVSLEGMFTDEEMQLISKMLSKMLSDATGDSINANGAQMDLSGLQQLSEMLDQLKEMLQTLSLEDVASDVDGMDLKMLAEKSGIDLNDLIQKLGDFQGEIEIAPKQVEIALQDIIQSMGLVKETSALTDPMGTSVDGDAEEMMEAAVLQAQSGESQADASSQQNYNQDSRGFAEQVENVEEKLLQQLDAVDTKAANNKFSVTMDNSQKIMTALNRSTNANKIMDQILNATKANLKVTENGSELLIKLNPKELGNVALKISINNHVLTAEINVANQAVKEAIESNLDDLRNALGDKGFNIEGLDVNVNQDSGDETNAFSDQLKDHGAHKDDDQFENSLENAETPVVRSSIEGLDSDIDYLG